MMSQFFTPFLNYILLVNEKVINVSSIRFNGVQWTATTFPDIGYDAPRDTGTLLRTARSAHNRNENCAEELKVTLLESGAVLFVVVNAQPLPPTLQSMLCNQYSGTIKYAASNSSEHTCNCFPLSTQVCICWAASFCSFNYLSGRGWTLRLQWYQEPEYGVVVRSCPNHWWCQPDVHQPDAVFVC